MQQLFDENVFDCGIQAGRHADRRLWSGSRRDSVSRRPSFRADRRS
jgi:hypothetical protein